MTTAATTQQDKLEHSADCLANPEPPDIILAVSQREYWDVTYDGETIEIGPQTPDQGDVSDASLQCTRCDGFWDDQMNGTFPKQDWI